MATRMATRANASIKLTLSDGELKLSQISWTSLSHVLMRAGLNNL